MVTPMSCLIFSHDFSHIYNWFTFSKKPLISAGVHFKVDFISGEPLEKVAHNAIIKLRETWIVDDNKFKNKIGIACISSFTVCIILCSFDERIEFGFRKLSFKIQSTNF